MKAALGAAANRVGFSGALRTTGASHPQPHPSHDQVVNKISEYLISQTADILPTALVQSVDPERGGAEADAELERRVDRMRLSLGAARQRRTEFSASSDFLRLLIALPDYSFRLVCLFW